MSSKKASPKKAPAAKKIEKTPEEYSETLLTSEEREEMIAEAAYYRAEQRGFDPTGVEEDWYEAEKIVDEYLYREVEEAAEH